MSTLAASFMADFDEEDEEELQQQIQAKTQQIKQEPKSATKPPNTATGVKKELGADDGEEKKDGDDQDVDMDSDEDEDDDENEQGKPFESGKNEDKQLPQERQRRGGRLTRLRTVCHHSNRMRLTAAVPSDQHHSNMNDVLTLVSSSPSTSVGSSSLLPQLTDDPVAPTFTTSTSITDISALLHSDKLQSHLKTIDAFQRSSSGTTESNTAASSSIVPPVPINKEVEYPYIVYSNELAFEIDSHIQSLHKLARDLYAPRYNELEQLLSNPLDYARVASLIGNETDMTKIGKLLQGTGIANNILLTISVTATTTRGKPLPESELEKLRAVCQTILDLDAAKTRIHSYISSRMAAVAPNVSAMLGPELAARLVALAGGIKNLSEIPACNLQVLGKKGKQASGLSRVSQGVHEGMIMQAPVLHNIPPTLKMKGLRLLAGKLALATRLDAFTDDTDDSTGRGLIADIRDKIEKWQEAPAARLNKALPIPLQRSKPHRGGKRYRKHKELMAITEVAKQKNRVMFGKEEITDDYTGEGMGMIGQEGSGVLKIKNKEAKLAKRLSKKTQARLKRTGGVAIGGVGGAVTSLSHISGTASSIAFTPMQGMQLVKTEQIQRVKAANDSYFSNVGSFTKVKAESNPTTTTTATATAGMKRSLPPVPTFAATTTAQPPEKKQKL